MYCTYWQGCITYLERLVFFFFAFSMNVQWPRGLEAGDPIDPRRDFINQARFKVFDPAIPGNPAFADFFTMSNRSLHHSRMSKTNNRISLFVAQNVVKGHYFVWVGVMFLNLSGKKFGANISTLVCKKFNHISSTPTFIGCNQKYGSLAINWQQHFNLLVSSMGNNSRPRQRALKFLLSVAVIILLLSFVLGGTMPIGN